MNKGKSGFIPDNPVDRYAALPWQDPEKKASLVRAIGEKRLNELLDLIPHEIVKVTSRLEGIDPQGLGAEAVRFEELSREAHGIKGVALNYGLSRLAYVAESVQEFCRRAGDGDVDLLVRRLQECSSDVVNRQEGRK